MITIDTVGGSGEVLTFTVSNIGTYPTIDEFSDVLATNVSSSGSDLSSDLTFRVKSFNLIYGGSGYDLPPSVVISGNATATANSTDVS